MVDIVSWFWEAVNYAAVMCESVLESVNDVKGRTP